MCFNLNRKLSIVGTALLSIALLLGSGNALAMGPCLSAFTAKYPNSLTGSNASCQTCHQSIGEPYNGYGWALRVLLAELSASCSNTDLNNGTLAAALGNIEGLDSDMDVSGGFSNLEEINADAQPGWTTGANNTVYFDDGSTTAGQEAPGGIADLDPSPVNQPPVDIDATGLTDISGDAVPDVAVLKQFSGKRPRVRYYSGANRKKFAQVAYLSSAWTGVATATLADASQDGVADDPAVAVLGRRLSNDRLSVQVRLAAGGAELARINFLNNRWTPVDVVVIDDANGDGVSDDTAIGVLGQNTAQGSQKQTTLQVRRLSDGSLLREVYYNNDNWTPLAAGVVQRTGQSPLLAVLAEKNSSKEIRVQARLLSDGSLQRTKTFLNDQWRGLDLAILTDTDGNGVGDDASYMVLAVNPGNGLKRVQVRGTSGALVKNLLVMNDLWQARRIFGSDDISGNLFEELGVLGNRISDGKARIELQDFDTGAITGNIFP
jgi:hypothetical protein